MTRILDPARFDGGIQPARTNLIPNPSFEVDTVGWQTFNANATIARSTTWAAVGTASVAVTATTAGPVGVLTVTQFAATGATVFTAQVQARTAVTGRQLILALDWYDAGNVYLSSSTSQITNSVANTTHTLALNATAPATATKAHLYARALNATIGEIFYFDAFLVEAGGVLQPYFDGGSPGCRWTGTAHNSTSQTVLDVGGAQLVNVGGLNWADAPVTSVLAPAAAGDVATKSYVDTNVRAAPNVQVFTLSGTWTKPAGAMAVSVVCIGGGGGGGSGRCGAVGTVRGGAGGGSGAALSRALIPASALPATVSVTIGAGGSGGSTQGSVDSNGFAGSTGGDTHFGDFPGDSYVLARPGEGGAGGVGIWALGGITSYGVYGGGDGGRGGGDTPGPDGVTAPLAGVAGRVGQGAGGGGGGGAVDATNVGWAGASGGMYPGGNPVNAAGGPVVAYPGNNGTDGSSAPLNAALLGGGGGGGAGHPTTDGGAGGAGGLYGGGGGGGGGSENANFSRAGGRGGEGICVVTTYF